MVKQEIIYWRYLWKTQYFLLLIPLILMLLSILPASYDGESTKNLLVFVVFPITSFPIISSLYQIGSIHHKELLLTYPLNLLIFGWIRPVLLSLLYSLAFTGSLMLTDGYTNEELAAAFAATLLYMNLSSFFLIFFKNVAMGIALPLAYLFFGLFTTGSGQGYFYLMQWNRANPDLSLIDCIITQVLAAGIISLSALYFLKRRNKYHWAF